MTSADEWPAHFKISIPKRYLYSMFTEAVLTMATHGNNKWLSTPGWIKNCVSWTAKCCWIVCLILYWIGKSVLCSNMVGNHGARQVNKSKADLQVSRDFVHMLNMKTVPQAWVKRTHGRTFIWYVQRHGVYPWIYRKKLTS